MRALLTKTINENYRAGELANKPLQHEKDCGRIGRKTSQGMQVGAGVRYGLGCGSRAWHQVKPG